MTIDYVNSTIGYVNLTIGYVNLTIGYGNLTIGYVNLTIGYVNLTIGYVVATALKLGVIHLISSKKVSPSDPLYSSWLLKIILFFFRVQPLSFKRGWKTTNRSWLASSGHQTISVRLACCNISQIILHTKSSNRLGCEIFCCGWSQWLECFAGWFEVFLFWFRYFWLGFFILWQNVHCSGRQWHILNTQQDTHFWVCMKIVSHFVKCDTVAMQPTQINIILETLKPCEYYH